jgi:hypothetical protein
MLSELRMEADSMALYQISYDIAEEDASEYQRLWALLRQLGALRILYSQWIIEAGDRQSDIFYNQLRPLVRASDRLLVQEVTKEAHWDQLLIPDELFRQLLKTKAR